MPLTPDIQKELKEPFGTLIPEAKVTRQKVHDLLKDAKMVIAVGDATTERLLLFDIIPAVAIIDGKERRTKRTHPRNYQAEETRCNNPNGTISAGATRVIKNALSSGKRTRIIVDGEEDLLALPAFVHAPDDSAVLYGQPLEGLVIVNINSEKRKKAKDLMDRISVE